MPSKLDSNQTGLAFCEEQSIGVLPGTPIWRALEPNSYNDFGGDTPTVARTPINASRQRQRGSVVDLDAMASFGHDFLQHGLVRLLKSFFFAAVREKADTASYEGAAVPITSATITTYTAAAGFTFLATNLVLASGFTNAANNGLKLLSAATGTTLTTTGNVAEAAPPAAARIQAVGVQGANADINVLVTAGIPALTSTALNFTTLGLTVGEWVYLGADGAGFKFANNNGFARVSAIAASVLTFDITTWTPVTEVGTGKTIRLFYGKVLRNELTTALIVQKTVQFERQLGVNAAVGVNQQAEYIVGCVGNELTLNMPQADKLTVDMGFVGIDTDEQDSSVAIKAGTRVSALGESLINTSKDMVRASIYLQSAASAASNPTMVYGYLDSMTLTVSNGITPAKALGRLGAFDVNAADFVVGGSVTAYFTDIAAVAAVRAQSPIGIFNIFAQSNAGFVFDCPNAALGGGRLKVEKDKPIEMPVEQSSYQSANGYTLMYTNFPYLPTAAMPT